MKIKRADLLKILSRVEGGLTTAREIVSQSSCFVFTAGLVYTFNDEIACSCPLPKIMSDMDCAVAAKPLLDLLQKMSEDEIELEETDGVLLVKGARKRAKIRMESEVLLPIEDIDEPVEWWDLHPDFCKAVSACVACAGKDVNAFILTCIHLHPDFLECCDNAQMLRWFQDTGFEEPVLVRAESIRKIAKMDMVEASVTDSWLHLQDADQMRFSVRLHKETFHDLNALVDASSTGNPATLPTGIAEAVERANVFSSENSGNNQIKIDLKKGILKATGEGVNGIYEEIRDVKYSGPPISFIIAPELLSEISEKHNDCTINEKTMRIETDAWVLITSLGAK